MSRLSLSHPRRLFILFGWTRHSTYLLAAFLLVISLIIYFWWPLAVQVFTYVNWNGAWWRYFDWLLVGIFLVMTLLIMARADLRMDTLIVLIGLFGGLVIESWGTQTSLWFYFTAERPPLWIIPAWPIASLSIDRITRLMSWVVERFSAHLRKVPGLGTFLKQINGVVNYKTFYWLTFLSFYGLMFSFVTPTFNKTFTIGALVLCALFILTPTDHRMAFLTFIAGSSLGYFLELWGTTRQCWTYYTYQTPPSFAVLAHGMAAVAFWRAGLLVKLVFNKLEILLWPVKGMDHACSD